MIIHRRLVIEHHLYAGLFIFPFRKDYNLLEDLEGLHAADWKENTTASEVKGGRGKAGEAQGEAQDEQAQPTPGVAPGEAFSSLHTSVSP